MSKAKLNPFVPCVISDMEIKYSSHFKRAYKKLDSSLQKKAEKSEDLFRKNPFDSRLDTHKLGGKLQNFYSFSIDHKNRIVFAFASPLRVIFLDIGDHSIYHARG